MEEIIKQLLQRGIIKKEEINIYYFGLQCLVLKMAMFVSYFFIAFVMNKIKEFVVIMLVFVPLRKSSGGYHAKTKVGCYFVSCFSLIIILFLSGKINNRYISTIILVVEDIFFCTLAPVDNENKKMNEEERYYFKTKTRECVLKINIICLIILILRFNELYEMLVYGILMAAIFLIIGKIQSITINRKTDRL